MPAESGSHHHSEGEVKARLTIGRAGQFVTHKRGEVYDAHSYDLNFEIAELARRSEAICGDRFPDIASFIRATLADDEIMR